MCCIVRVGYNVLTDCSPLLTLGGQRGQNEHLRFQNVVFAVKILLFGYKQNMTQHTGYADIYI